MNINHTYLSIFTKSKSKACLAKKRKEQGFNKFGIFKVQYPLLIKQYNSNKIWKKSYKILKTTKNTLQN